jgi:preprotein translocase subunit YajC
MNLEAFAQNAGGSGGGSAFVSFIPLILIFLIFYFLLILPQQRKAKKHQEMLGALKKGDEIITSGGIHGKIVGLTDTILTLEIADKVKIKVYRSYIAGKSELK